MLRRHLLILTVAATVLHSTTEVEAQGFSLSLGNATFLDRQVQPTRKAAPPEQPAPEQPAPGMVGPLGIDEPRRGLEAPAEAKARPAADGSIWSERKFSLQYEYWHKNWSTHSNLEVDIHVTTPELSLKTEGDTLLTLSASYLRSSAKDEVGGRSDGDSVLLQAVPGQELLRFFWKDKPATTNLFANLLLQYRHTDVEAHMLPNVDNDVGVVVPNLVLNQVLSARTHASLVGAYAWEFGDSNLGTLPDILDGSRELLSILLRVDAVFPGLEQMVLGQQVVQAFATAEWRHDTEVEPYLPVFETLRSDDWAVFSANVQWPLADRWDLRASYTLETLRYDYTLHKAQLRVEYDLGT